MSRTAISLERCSLMHLCRFYTVCGGGGGGGGGDVWRGKGRIEERRERTMMIIIWLDGLEGEKDKVFVRWEGGSEGGRMRTINKL